MKTVLFLTLILASLLPANEWVSLFDGKTLKGWTAQAGVNWSVKEGTITADSGPIALLITEKKYENYELKLEFKAAKGTNSGVFLNTKATVKDEFSDCYEVNISDTANAFPTGSVVKHVKVEGMGERDEWRTYHLKVNQGVVTVILDSQKLFEYHAHPRLPAGHIGLQKNKGKISFRNLFVKELIPNQ